MNTESENPLYNEVAERYVIGCLLLHPDQMLSVSSRIGPDDFHLPQHQLVARCLESLVADKQPVNLNTVIGWLRQNNLLSVAGGEEVVRKLPRPTDSVLQLGFFTALVQRKALLRRVKEFASQTLEQVGCNDVNPIELVERCRQNLDQLVDPWTDSARSCLSFLSPSALAALQPPADQLLVGDYHITRGSVFVLGGPPGVGKSRAAVALAFAGSSQQDWFGMPLHRRFKTMILQNENGTHRLKQEFAGRDQPSLDAFIRISQPPLCGMTFEQTEFRHRLAAAVAEFQPDVFILDPWNAAARDDKQRDYLETLNLVRSVLPEGEAAPALGIVAHTRKPKTDERASGRSLLNLLAGSYVLGSVPRTAFVMQPASDDPSDDRVVWTCCKNNDGQLGERSAWHRSDGSFQPCADFDWNAFNAPLDGRGSITKEDLEALFEGGKRLLARKEAIAQLEELTGSHKSTCYSALNLNGKFRSHLAEQDGLLSWKP